MASSSSSTLTLVLVGKRGNGKSATGNTLAGNKIFKVKLSMQSVTTDIKLAVSKRVPGKTIRIIDTPGLLDNSLGHEEIGKEIVKCFDLAKTGIHAVLLVLSVKNRFSEEEEAAIICLQNLFGSKIFDHVIVVFTGGDTLEDDPEEVYDNANSLKNYINEKTPKNLKDIIQLCGHRVALFDNKTKDESKKSEQVDALLRLVDKVLEANDGEPYTHKLFGKEGVVRLSGKDVGYHAKITSMKSEIQKAYDMQLKQITEKMESDLIMKTKLLEMEKKMAGNEVAKLNSEVSEMNEAVKMLKKMVKASEEREEAARNVHQMESDLLMRTKIREMEKEKARNEVARLNAEVSKMNEAVKMLKKMVKASEEREEEARNVHQMESDLIMRTKILEMEKEWLEMKLRS